MGDEKKIIAKVGETVKTTLRRNKVPKRRTVHTKKAQDVVAGITDDEPRYIRRKKAVGIRFFDLGVRLRSVPMYSGPLGYIPDDSVVAPVRNDAYYNEYIEILLDKAAAAFFVEATYPNKAYPTSGQIKAYDAVLLGTNPLSSYPANVTGRSLPFCMPLPYDIRGYDPDYLFYQPLNSIALVAPPNHHYLWTVGGQDPEWKLRETTPADATELWNPSNLVAGLTLRDGHFDLAVKPNTVGIRSSNDFERYYVHFDVSDTANFKVTAEPDFAADEASVSIGKSTEIYLKPKVWGFHWFYQRQANPPVTVFETDWIGRLTIYPAYAEYDSGSIPPLSGSMRYSLLRSPIVSGGSHAAGTPPHAYATAIWMVGPEYTGDLCAIIRIGEQVRYVWRRTSISLGTHQQDIYANIQVPEWGVVWAPE